jgi:hypothetical protein
MCRITLFPGTNKIKYLLINQVFVFHLTRRLRPQQHAIYHVFGVSLASVIQRTPLKTVQPRIYIRAHLDQQGDHLHVPTNHVPHKEGLVG